MRQAVAVVDESFYARLLELERFQQVVSTHLHHDVPGDWVMIITDVRGSTKAIEEGRYRDVNALGVASILALRNAMKDLDLPFVFGGDGATILIPSSRTSQADCAMRGVRALATEAFGLELRVARVPVGTLLAQGYSVKVARFRQSKNVALAAFSGRGFQVAEEWIKDPQTGDQWAISADGPAEADLSGFECRWQPVASQRGNMVSLLVVALAKQSEERESCYRELLDVLSDIGCLNSAPPFSERQMKLRGVFGDYTLEARIKTGKPEGPAVEQMCAELRKSTAIGQVLLWTGKTAGGFDGKNYKKQFLENTDHRKFDEAVRMVLDMSPEQLEQLKTYLSDQNARGQLAYGMHVSDKALITCMVGSYDQDHIHFVDGADGGYALAAKPLKAQLTAQKRMSRMPLGF